MTLPDEVLDLALICLDALTVEKVEIAMAQHPEMDMFGILRVAEQVLRQEAKSVSGEQGFTVEEAERVTSLYLVGLARFIARIDARLARQAATT